jgi:hypothetical protein
MPHASGTRPHHYRSVLYLGIAVPAAVAAFGVLPFAVVASAFALPAVYLVYLYDTDVWERRPSTVVLLVFALPAALAGGFTILWREVVFKDQLHVPVNLIASTLRLREVVILCLFVPVAGEVLKQVGAIFLLAISRRHELLDGLAFGVMSGVAYAALETLVLQRDLVVHAPLHIPDANAAVWVLVILTVGVAKPVIYGAATGIACAEFAGTGRGSGGLRPRYLLALLAAIAANVLFQSGLYGSGLQRGSGGPLIGLLWSALLAALLVIQMRKVTHRGLLESAVEAGAGTSASHCPHCDMALVPRARFCVACGTAVAALPKRSRRAAATRPAAAASAATSAPGDKRASVAGHHKVSRPLFIGVVVVVALGVTGGGALAVSRSTTKAVPDIGALVDLFPDASGPAGAAGPAAVAIAEGLSVRPAAGWKVTSSSPGFVLLSGRGGAITVHITRGDPTASGQGLVGAFLLSVLSPIVTDLGPSQPVTEAPPTTRFSSAGSAGYRGTLASGQLSVAVEGIVYGAVRTDGVAMVVTTVNRRGQAAALAADDARMLDSVIDSA